MSFFEDVWAFGCNAVGLEASTRQPTCEDEINSVPRLENYKKQRLCKIHKRLLHQPGECTKLRRLLHHKKSRARLTVAKKKADTAALSTRSATSNTGRSSDDEESIIRAPSSVSSEVSIIRAPPSVSSGPPEVSVAQAQNGPIDPKGSLRSDDDESIICSLGSIVRTPSEAKAGTTEDNAIDISDISSISSSQLRPISIKSDSEGTQFSYQPPLAQPRHETLQPRPIPRRIYDSDDSSMYSSLHPPLQRLDSSDLPSLVPALSPRSAGAPAVEVRDGPKCQACQSVAVDPIQLLCDHWYCSDCLRDWLSVALDDKSMFPPQCCNLNVEIEHARMVLSDPMFQIYFRREQEYNHLPDIRVLFCPDRECGEIIPIFGDDSEVVRCLQCDTDVCVTCRQKAHPGDVCFEDEETKRTRAQAKQQGWQECPKCRAVVQLQSGCNHITCLICRHEFCYLCQRDWIPRRQCICPVWDEKNLLRR